ncbi:MAG: rod shape-determining protein MreC [Sphingomonadales bacterium]|nr:rod shape-determining protein MreC [Sphingomonadales bacterium]MDE2570115.1 rod shape-determining protein MreC [Sphingomonadales bacterium]
MAPSKDRRPGYSRRAQYGIFTRYVVAVFGVFVGFGLLALSLTDPGAFSFARGTAAEAARPIGEANAVARSTGQDFFSAIAGYFQAGQQNAELRREVEAARANALTMKALEDENRRLKALVGVIEADRKPVAAARLIGSTGTSMRRFALLSAGARQGVRVGQPVRATTGLIGRVLDVWPSTSRVLLVTDPDNVVPVRRASDGLPAMVTGGSDGTIMIRLINTGVALVRPGDVFLTSGSGGLYPPGIPVAVAVKTTRDGAVARLAADPSEAEFVVVEPVFQPAAEQDQQAEDAAEAAKARVP